ncbi:kinase domain-containing [Cryptosporidium sp. chipmunk genotype I]|uniref:kinase domain-containing n=1 Tax=Cryptosporidium sp. chipmunk genotype I TaxID=1280935 RepID=UPI003519FDB0|nr:kinase domain-containing [Cryptosporidium sp. chipmunk genotype I]
MPNDKVLRNDLPDERNTKFPKFKVGERVGRYVKIKEVGSGSYGKAILVKDIYKGRDYVMKIINISKLSSNERKDAINEVKLLSSIRHPYIVCFKESFVDDGFLNIVMEYADGGDLFRKVNVQKQLKKNFLEKQVVRWLAQALLGLAHLHNRKILHRDIKSQNIFISYNGLKIGDFGIAKVLENTGAFAKTTIGTPYYLSPEICLSKPYSWSSDIWALGCVAYEMCSLKVPFDAPNLKMLVEKITNGIFLPIPNSYSEGLRRVIMDMLIIDSSRRPTVMELLNYPIIESELRTMKKEAYVIFKSNINDSNLVNNATSVIEIISEIQDHSKNAITRLNNFRVLGISSRDGSNHLLNKSYNSIGDNEKKTEKIGSEVQIKPPIECKCEVGKIQGIDAKNEIEGKHASNCNYIINCNRKETNGSKNSSNAQTSTTSSYSYDDKDSTANTKLNEIYKSNSTKDYSINLFPFQVETSATPQTKKNSLLKITVIIMDKILNISTENDSSQQANIANSNTEELDQPLKFVMQDVQEHFKRASQTILSRIDEMGSRIDQLEFMLNDLISEVESSSPMKERTAHNQNDSNHSEAKVNDFIPIGGTEQVNK